MKNVPTILILALAFNYEVNAGKIIGTMDSTEDKLMLPMPIPVDLASGTMENELESKDGLMDAEDEWMDRQGTEPAATESAACKEDVSAVMAAGDIGSTLLSLGLDVAGKTLGPFGKLLGGAVVAFDTFSSAFGIHKDEFCNDPDIEEIKENIGKVQDKLNELENQVKQGFSEIDTKVSEFQVAMKIDTHISDIQKVHKKCFENFCSLVCKNKVDYKKLGGTIVKTTPGYAGFFKTFASCIDKNQPYSISDSLIEIDAFIRKGPGCKATNSATYSIYSKQNSLQEDFCKPDIRDLYNSLFVEGTYYLLMIDELNENIGYRTLHQNNLKTYVKNNMDLYWEHCTQAQCKLGFHSTYGLTATNSDKCCEVKENVVETKCGALEGPCKDENNCKPGHTCGEYYNDNNPAIIPPGTSCFETDKDYMGHDLGLDAHFVNITDAKACQTLCLNKEDCKFWTFGIWENPVYPGNCWLKSSKANSRSSERFISGPKICGNCFKDSVDFYGNDIQILTNIKNPKVCQTKCQENNECKFWTYGLSLYPGHCWLKSSNSDRRTNAGVMSGPRSCEKMCSECPNWTYQVGNKCIQCGCNVKGAKSCDKTSGACKCQEGYQGQKCFDCHPNFCKVGSKCMQKINCPYNGRGHYDKYGPQDCTATGWQCGNPGHPGRG